MNKYKHITVYCMTHIDRLQVYVPDDLVTEARQKGLTNVSAFVREKLEEYVNAGNRSPNSVPGSRAPIKEVSR